MGTSRNIVAEKLDNMSDFEIARWQALMDAVNIVAEKAADRKIKFSNLNIKPSAIEHYVEATCDIYCRRIIEEREANKRRKEQKIQTIVPTLVDAISKCGEPV